MRDIPVLTLLGVLFLTTCVAGWWASSEADDNDILRRRLTQVCEPDTGRIPHAVYPAPPHAS